MVQGLYIGKNALMVNQAALTVVSNNIANANTIGYSKQRVNLVSMQDGSIASNALQQAKLGYGVDIEIHLLTLITVMPFQAKHIIKPSVNKALLWKI